MVLNIHNSQFPRPVHFLGYAAQPREMEVLLFLTLERALVRGVWYVKTQSRVEGHRHLFFSSSVSFPFLEDRKINENNSYKTEAILGLFWSL